MFINKFKKGEHVLVLSEGRKGRIIAFDIYDDDDDYTEVYCLVKFDEPFTVENETFSTLSNVEKLSIAENWFDYTDLRSIEPRTRGFSKFIKERGL